LGLAAASLKALFKSYKAFGLFKASRPFHVQGALRLFKVQGSTKDRFGRHFHISGIPETSKCQKENSCAPAAD
jgi:hypothetical protein